jgi:hypothetical protein
MKHIVICALHKEFIPPCINVITLMLMAIATTISQRAIPFRKFPLRPPPEAQNIDRSIAPSPKWGNKKGENFPKLEQLWDRSKQK